ncbi:MAG TPA: YbhB/YbcL family Raf kinase inhibitor-like protein [Steroidobacteraceae bacterium]|nr:YbhB/YbcL family Raf kinase inhibitor-like protein [Steroidobacteraceae bacterium]
MNETTRHRAARPPLACILLGTIATAALSSQALAAEGGGGAVATAFKLESSVIRANATIGNDQVFNGFGCSGKNLSPPLRWSGAPPGTKSFALTVYDPDAPTGSGWWHWVLYNIPATVTELPQGAGGPGGQLPSGALQGRTDFGTTGYGGPCPPPGNKPHRYVFTVYALKTEKLDVPADASPAMIGFNLGANKLASATLTGTYGR